MFSLGQSSTLKLVSTTHHLELLGHFQARHGKRIVEDNAPLFLEENLFLVEMFDETFDIWHIYSL